VGTQAWEVFGRPRGVCHGAAMACRAGARPAPGRRGRAGVGLADAGVLRGAHADRRVRAAPEEARPTPKDLLRNWRLPFLAWSPLMSGLPQRRMRRCEPGDRDRLARADHDPPCGAAHARLRPKKTAIIHNLNRKALTLALFGGNGTIGVTSRHRGEAVVRPKRLDGGRRRTSWWPLFAAKRAVTRSGMSANRRVSRFRRARVRRSSGRSGSAIWTGRCRWGIAGARCCWVCGFRGRQTAAPGSDLSSRPSAPGRACLR
jgi:hypothetical protein